MTAAFFRNDRFFYPLLFILWTLFLLIRFGGYRYFDMPLFSAGLERIGGGTNNATLLYNSIAALRKCLDEEKNSAEQPHILQNLGCAYCDMYKETRNRFFLDSAFYFVQQSVIQKPDNARFHYNFGRLFTEIGDAPHALRQYDLALRCDSTHILALSNAATCSYFALGRKDAAARYFARALAIDSMLPVSHVVLGLIALDERNYTAARDNFEKEIIADRVVLEMNRYPLTRESINYAGAIAHRNLMTLYSTQFPDKSVARGHFDEYLKLETDTSKKTRALQEMKKYWGE